MPSARQNKIAPVEPLRATEAKGGGLRSDLKRFTRERIMNAALSSFQEIGFKETTVERIVELAGTTAPTFYRHFAGKDELLPFLQDHLSKAVRECLSRLNADHVQSPRTFVPWLKDYLSVWNQVHRLCKAFWDATSLEAEMAPSTFMLMFNTGDTIDRLLPKARGEELEQRKMRLGLSMLLLDRLAYLVSIAPDEKTREQLIETFSDMMWHSVFD